MSFYWHDTPSPHSPFNQIAGRCSLSFEAKQFSASNPTMRGRVAGKLHPMWGTHRPQIVHFSAEIARDSSDGRQLHRVPSGF